MHHIGQQYVNSTVRSFQLIAQLLRHFDGESRIGDFFEGDITIGETAFGFDRFDDIANPFRRGNAGVVEAGFDDFESIGGGFLIHLQNAGDQR